MRLQEAEKRGCHAEHKAQFVDADEARRSDTARFATYFHRMLERGIYLPPSQFEAMFVSLAHSDANIDATIVAARESLHDLRST